MLWYVDIRKAYTGEHGYGGSDEDELELELLGLD